MKTYNNFTQAYVSLLKDVYHTPEHESSPRGLKVRERIGHSFRITNPRDRLLYVPHRDWSVAYYVAEGLWYLSGNDSTEWISRYSSFWRNISDDGKTANSAYGARIFRPHDRIAAMVFPDWTQWEYVKEELKKDPDSRRAVIHIRSPVDSVMANKDVPCTLTLQFFIRDEALHLVVNMRSSDLWLGIANDVPAFTLFQEKMANELGVELGTYTHTSNSLHIYSRHFDLVEKVLLDPWVTAFPTRAQPMPAMPSSKVPTDELEAFEAEVCKSTDEASMQKCILAVEKLGVEPYWKDWAYILAWHRAGKLELSSQQAEAMSRVGFVGYKLFNR